MGAKRKDIFVGILDLLLLQHVINTPSLIEISALDSLVLGIIRRNRRHVLVVFFLLHQPIRRCIDEANIHYALLYCLNHLLLCSSSLVKKLAKHKFGLVLHSKTSLPVSDEFGIHLGIVRIEEWFDPVRDWIVWMKDVKDALATRE